MFNELFFWFPWLNFYSEIIFLQIISLYVFYLFIKSDSFYYLSIFLFLNIIIWGITLCFFNFEVFAGFLWVIEFTAFFILILFLLSFNFDGALFPKKQSFFFTIILFFTLYLICLYSNFFINNINIINSKIVWSDYYEAIFNTIMNDIFSLYLSYYSFNSFLLFLFALILFFITIICVLMFKLLQTSAQQESINLHDLFNFFSDYCLSFFLRKQNLFNQIKRKPVNRLVKIKKSNVAEK
jgi:hypothetical protein